MWYIRIFIIMLVNNMKENVTSIYIAKLEYNEHEYSEFTAITNNYSCPGKFLI